MATAIAAPPLEPRYQARNSLSGKWPAILRRAVWMGVFIYAFVMFGVNFVHLRLLPTLGITIQRTIYRGAHDFPMIILVSLMMAVFAGAVVVVVLALSVKSSYVGVLGDRLRMSAAGWAHRDVMFRDIAGVELITVSSWPRRGSFLSDVMRQVGYLGTAHWMQHGMSQFFKSEATLVMVKVAGSKWVRAHLLDVDDPGALLRALDAAVADYVGANGPEHMPKR